MVIYDEIGGAPSVSLAVDALYERILADPGLVGYFEGVDVGRVKGHQRLFIGAALGGPEQYAGRDMGAAHAGLRISDEAFDAVVGHLVAVLTDLGVPVPTIEAIGSSLAPLRADIVSESARTS
jgi:hemoglobin